MYTFIIFCAVFGIVLKLIEKLTAGECMSSKFLMGKTAIVTGGNSGIGFETALDLAKRGCKVIIADVVNSENVVQKIIEETNNNNVFYKHLDLSSLASVRKFAEDILSSEKQLDILINNAGIAHSAGVFSDDGLLKILQVNYFGPFLLTHLLLGPLRMSRGRIVFVSSSLAFVHRINYENINLPYKSKFALSRSYVEYGNSKLCIVIAAKMFAEKLKSSGILCYSVHPGIVNSRILDTTYNAMDHSPVTFFWYWICWIFYMSYGKTSKEGAQTTLHCALSEEVRNQSGQYFWDCKPFWVPSASTDDQICSKIWEMSEDLVKLEKDEKI